MKNKYVVVVAVVLWLGIGGYAVAEVATSQLSACVSRNGETRLVIAGFTKKQACEKGEQLISWNTMGPKGDKGDTGLTGEQGIQGPKGDTGATGEQGQIGLTGPQGPKGDQGLDGKDGANGQDGAQGPKGDTGKDGAPGVDGTNATSFWVLDGQGRKLGYLLDIGNSGVRILSLDGQWSAWLDQKVDTQEIRMQTPGAAVYEQPDCAGTPMVLPWEFLGHSINAKDTRTEPKYYVADTERSPETKGFASRLSADGKTCSNTQTSAITAWHSKEVQLPFTEPVAWPLKVVQE
jgi:hypothetical protein